MNKKDILYLLENHSEEIALNGTAYRVYNKSVIDKIIEANK